MATIYDVAKKAGVSITAVSLVVNDANTSRVGIEKRKHILAIAKSLGYAPSGLAKALSNGSTNIVGLVVPMKDPIFFNNFIAQVLAGIQSALMERNYHLMIYTHTAKRGRITEGELTQSRYVDGVIVLNTRMCSKADIEGSIADLDRARIPFVMANCYSAREGINYVGVNDHALGQSAASFLIQRKHHKIAVISGATRSPMSSRLLSGFKAELKRHGIELPAEWHCFSEYESSHIAAFVMETFSKRSRPTAIFCADDQFVPDVYSALAACNLVIPDQVSVLGRGNLAIGLNLRPMLSSFEVPAFEMGKQAAELLIEAVKSRAQSSRRVILESSLIEREST